MTEPTALREQWFRIFRECFARDFGDVFPEIDLHPHVDVAGAVVSAVDPIQGPMVSAPLPGDFLREQPFGLAGQMASRLRTLAEESGLVPPKPA